MAYRKTPLSKCFTWQSVVVVRSAPGSDSVQHLFYVNCSVVSQRTVRTKFKIPLPNLAISITCRGSLLPLSKWQIEVLNKPFQRHSTGCRNASVVQRFEELVRKRLSSL